MHRDIKPENVLLNSGCFVLADFGEAAPIQEGRLSRMCGTPGYMAPELLDGRRYNELVDLFSLGALLHLCICGQRLFPGQSSRDILKSNCEGQINLNLHASKFLNAAGLEFFGALLAREPSKRLSAQNALEHRWLHGGHEEQGVTRTEMSETWSNGSSNKKSCSESCNDCTFSSCASIGRNKVHHSGLGREAKSEKRSMISSIRGLLCRPRLAGDSTLTSVVPTSSKEADFQGHDSVGEAPTQEARKAHRRLIPRTSEVFSWIRGKPKQEGYAPEDDLPDALAP